MAAPFDPVAALTEEQREKLADFERLLVQFNDKINLISRPSERRVRTEHTLHSLALAWRALPPGAQVVDFGTGGGLPAVPLAIRFPEAHFTAVDANGKKVRAVRAMARRLELENLATWKGRAEQWPGPADYSVTRATAPLQMLWQWHQRVAEPPVDAATRTAAANGSSDAWPEDAWPPGLLALKGGDLSEEITALEDAFPAARAEQHALRPLLEHNFFADKYIVAVRERRQ